MVTLRLFHGRVSGAERGEDWGVDGPVLGPLVSVSFTYGGVRLELPDGDCVELAQRDGLVHYDGVAYGDACVSEESATEQASHEKARAPLRVGRPALSVSLRAGRHPNDAINDEWDRVGPVLGPVESVVLTDAGVQLSLRDGERVELTRWEEGPVWYGGVMYASVNVSVATPTEAVSVEKARQLEKRVFAGPLSEQVEAMTQVFADQLVERIGSVAANQLVNRVSRFLMDRGA